MAFKYKMFETSQSFLLISPLTVFQIISCFTEMFRTLESMIHIDLRLLCAGTAEYLLFKVGLNFSFLFKKQREPELLLHLSLKLSRILTQKWLN